MATARFDDLTPGSEHAFELADPVDLLVARRPGEVPGVLAAAEEAVRLGGWVGGFVAYEAAPGLDPALPVREARPGPPLVALGVYRERVPVEPVVPAAGGGYEVARWEPGIGRDDFIAAVAAVHEAIVAGDTYQVNLTFPLHSRFAGDPFAWYRDLAPAQRGGYNAYLDFGDTVVVSASPELFFSLDGDLVETRPMKGTARRGRWSAEDRELAERLAASEKDRAENVMIVDLLRNDLGRVARTGSVRVERLFALERYETVWQLTSTVSARLRADVGLVDVFRSLFPCGSVTGAPKRSTMGIIRRLEPSPRGVYCGAVGFAGPGDGGGTRAVFNVPIRTVVVDRWRGTATYGVGCGITWGSDAAAEYEEARWKAQLLGERRARFDLVETLGWCPGAGFRRLDRHLERLASSAAYFGFRLDRAAVAAGMEGAVAGAVEPLRVRVVAGRDGSVQVAADALDDGRYEDPVRFAVAESTVPADDVLLFHKTTARDRYERPRSLHPGADDVLLVNRRGEVTEFTVANIAVLLDGVWYTPPLESGLLPGVYRAELLDRGALVERLLTVDDLGASEEIAWINSARGWKRATPL